MLHQLLGEFVLLTGRKLYARASSAPFSRRNEGTYDFQSGTSVMNWHIPSPTRILPICKKLAHKLLKRIASLHKDPRLPILAKHHIILVQRTCRAHTSCLFSLIGHIETQSALSLCIEHYEVHDGDGDHVLVHFKGEGVGAGRHRGVNDVAIGRSAAVGGYCRVG